MNAKSLIPLVAGLGIGGFALKLGIDTVKRARGAQQPAAKVQLWAAQADIPRGTEIAETMLKAVQFPANLIPPGAFKEKEKLIGRVPRLDAPAGLPVLEAMLAPPNTRPGIFVKPGYRAVAVKIDEGSGVDYHLEPGSIVDVVGSFTVRRDNRQETLATTIAENVEVAAVGPRVSVVNNEPPEKGATTNRQQIRAVTLFVRPDDVPKLLVTEQRGRIKLSLRNGDDGGHLTNPQTVSEGELTGEAPASRAGKEQKPESAGDSWADKLSGMFAKPKAPPEPEAAPAPPAPPPVPAVPPWLVVVYRGQDKETVCFRSRDSRERVDEPEPSRRVGTPGSLFGNTQRPKPPHDAAKPPTTQPENVTDRTQETGTEPQEPSE